MKDIDVDDQAYVILSFIRTVLEGDLIAEAERSLYHSTAAQSIDSRNSGTNTNIQRNSLSAFTTSGAGDRSTDRSSPGSEFISNRQHNRIAKQRVNPQKQLRAGSPPPSASNAKTNAATEASLSDSISELTLDSLPVNHIHAGAARRGSTSFDRSHQKAGEVGESSVGAEVGDRNNRNPPYLTDKPVRISSSL